MGGAKPQVDVSPLLNENTKTTSEAKEHSRSITKHKFKLSEEEKIIRRLLLVA